VVAPGYHAVFVFLDALATAGFVLYLIAMPETAPKTLGVATARRT
jgi:hypothetical protein